MRLNVTVRHGQVRSEVRSYVESKFAKLDRRLHDGTLVEVVLDRERNPKIPDDHVVEAELHLKGPNLHGREASTTYEAATDLLGAPVSLRCIIAAKPAKALSKSPLVQHAIEKRGATIVSPE